MKHILSMLLSAVFCLVALPSRSTTTMSVSQLMETIDSPVYSEPVAMHVSDSYEIDLIWQERVSSFSRKEGIRVFMGYSGLSMKGVISVRDNRVSGWIFGDDATYDVSTDADGNLVYTPQSAAERVCDRCSVNDVDDFAVSRPRIRVASTSDVDDPQWSEQLGESLVYNNDGVLFVYRLALPVSYKVFSTTFQSSVPRVKEYWATALAILNDLYVRELGVFFELVDDDRLIVTDPDYEWPSSTNTFYIRDQGTTATNKLIGAENYDVACGAAVTSDGYGGLTTMVAAYYKNWKGNCFIAYGYESISVIGHELGHTMGGLHTYTTGGVAGSTSTHTEVGTGQSVMSYGSPADFFALYNVMQIRRCQSYLPYLNYPERTDTIGMEKLRDINYSNFTAGIPTGNKPPRIDASNLKKHYRIPRDTYFQFNISATDPDGDELNYMAHQTNYDRSGTGCATYLCSRLQKDPTIRFQPTFYYSSAERKIKLTTASEFSPTATGTFYFWLAATDGKTITDWEEFKKHPHAMGYDMYETKLEVVDGTPFKITSSIPNRSTCGEKIRLTWSVDNNVFGEDSRVRILLSDDFGKTFKYVLKESAPNNGSCDVIFPHVAIGATVAAEGSYETIRAGVIKIEEIGGVAYALSAVYPYEEYNGTQTVTGGFMLWNSAIKFQNAPERYVTVNSEDDVPERANVTATLNGTNVDVTYTETRDGNVISRVWSAMNPYSDTNSYYEQIIVIENPSIAALPDIVVDHVKAKVYSISGMVYVEGAEGASIRIYDTTGRMLFERGCSAAIESVPLRPGIYIVLVDGVSYKLVV